MLFLLAAAFAAYAGRDRIQSLVNGVSAAQAAGGAPSRAPGETQETGETPKTASGDTTGTNPENAPETASQTTSDDTAQATSGDTAKATSDDTAKTTSDDTDKTASDDTTKATSDDTAKTAIASDDTAQTTSETPSLSAAKTPASGRESPEPAAETRLSPGRSAEPRSSPEQTLAPAKTGGDPAALEGGGATARAVGDSSAYSNKKYSWYFVKNKEHKPTRGASEIDISGFGGHYLGDTDRKVVYLTFDEGYENGYTPAILDILKEKGVKAAFFMTQPFMRDNPGLVKRISAEKHVCADHSVTHPSLPDCDDDKVIHEITETARYFKEVTGADMDPFFRPPSGEYSERTLYITRELGFTTVFWSYAYRDWVTDDQPGKDAAYGNVMDNLHPGEILLLHAVSQSNAEALPDIIDAVRGQGYEFGTLYELIQILD